MVIKDTARLKHLEIQPQQQAFTNFKISVHAAPISTVPQVVEVTAIINDSCMVHSGSVASPSTDMLAAIAAANEMFQTNELNLNYLMIDISELSDLSKTVTKNNPLWIAPFRPIIPSVKSLITITPVRHCELSLELDSRVHVMIQLSIFANYIRSQEWDDDYGDVVKFDLSQIKNKLYQSVCVLKRLVQQSLSSEGIERYIAQDYTKRWLSLNGQPAQCNTRIEAAQCNTRIEAAQCNTRIEAAQCNTRIEAAQCNTRIDAAQCDTRIDAAQCNTRIEAAQCDTRIDAAQCNTLSVDATPIKRKTSASDIINDFGSDPSRPVTNPSKSTLETITAANSICKDNELYLRTLMHSLSQMFNLSKSISTNLRSSVFTLMTKNHITITPVRHCELSLELDSRVHVMIQLSIFANFIGSQEWDDDNGDAVKTYLNQIKNILGQAVHALKCLVQQSLSSEGIERYIAQDYTKRWLSLNGQPGLIKRAFVMAAIEILTQTLETFRVNYTSVELIDTNFSSSC
ncbi:hypothetical protein Btru_058682 [Bulinus truncatus]|nr:hypothetical protein Btru_058682 [Bulinus truncatus]